MKVLGIILSIILMIVCIALSVIVELQKGEGSGLSSAIGGGSGSSYLSRNMSHTISGRLRLITKILAALYFVLALVLYFVIA